MTFPDPVAKALDDALVAVMAARSVWQAQAAAREDGGGCAHRDRAELATFGGDAKWLCPDCGQVLDG